MSMAASHIISNRITEGRARGRRSRFMPKQMRRLPPRDRYLVPGLLARTDEIAVQIVRYRVSGGILTRTPFGAVRGLNPRD